MSCFHFFKFVVIFVVINIGYSSKISVTIQLRKVLHGHKRLAGSGHTVSDTDKSDQRLNGRPTNGDGPSSPDLQMMKSWELFSLKTWLIMNFCLHWIGINWCIISFYNIRTKSKSLHLNGFSFMFIHEIYSSAQPVPKHPFNPKSPKNDAKKSKKVTFNFQVMKRLNIIYQEKFKVTRRKTLLKSHSLKQGKNTVKLQ